jgi:phosphoribosylglycinamide formyltransferase-1
VALGDALASYEPNLIILSGFMKLLPAELVSRFSPRIINTHPAYLPEFPGAHAVRDALVAGATETGASVIVVDEGVDTGQILAQRRVPLEPGDDETVLHDRIKLVERELLLEVLENISTPTGK